MITHLHGLACDMDVIPRICAERGVPLIEDAAQAFGARFAGRPLGSFGDVGIFSFGKYKNVNAFLGGVLTTRRAEVAEKVRAAQADWPLQELPGYLSEVGHGLATDLATWPPLFRAFTFWVFRFAFLQELSILNRQVSFDNDPELRSDLPGHYQCRMTPLQARLVLRQLAKVDELTRERIERARLYHDGLKDLPELMIAPLRTDFSHMYTYFPIQADDRNALLRHMMRSGRDVAGQHIKNCADFPAFAGVVPRLSERPQDGERRGAAPGLPALFAARGRGERARDPRVLRSPVDAGRGGGLGALGRGRRERAGRAGPRGGGARRRAPARRRLAIARRRGARRDRARRAARAARSTTRCTTAPAAPRARRSPASARCSAASRQRARRSASSARPSSGTAPTRRSPSRTRS